MATPNFTVGQRVKPKQIQCHGTIRFVGEIIGQEGTYIGIELDSPINSLWIFDGVHDGKKYFQVSPIVFFSFLKLKKSLLM